MNFTFRRQLTHQLYLILIFFVTTSCTGISGEVSFKPHSTPLKVSINTKGEIHFSVENSIEIPTPLGTLEVGIVVDPAEYFGVKNTLTVRVDGKDNIYDLKGQDFSIEFESGYYEKIGLSKNGENIYLILERVANSFILLDQTRFEINGMAIPLRPTIKDFVEALGEPSQTFTLKNGIVYVLDNFGLTYRTNRDNDVVTNTTLYCKDMSGTYQFSPHQQFSRSMVVDGRVVDICEPLDNLLQDIRELKALENLPFLYNGVFGERNLMFSINLSTKEVESADIDFSGN